MDINNAFNWQDIKLIQVGNQLIYRNARGTSILKYINKLQNNMCSLKVTIASLKRENISLRRNI